MLIHLFILIRVYCVWNLWAYRYIKFCKEDDTFNIQFICARLSGRQMQSVEENSISTSSATVISIENMFSLFSQN